MINLYVQIYVLDGWFFNRRKEKEMSLLSCEMVRMVLFKTGILFLFLDVKIRV